MTTLAGSFTYAYDINGQLISIVLPTGRMLTYSYDAPVIA